VFSIIALIHPTPLHAIDDPTSSESNLNGNNDEIDGLTQKIGEQTDETLISGDSMKQHLLVGSIIRRKDAIESAISRKKGWRKKLKQFTSAQESIQ
jgi:adenine-specific DNA methylase